MSRASRRSRKLCPHPHLWRRWTWARWSWSGAETTAIGRATLQDRHIKLLGKFFSLQHERSYFRRLVVNTARLSPDATDEMKDMLASAKEKGINVEQVCDPSVFEFDTLVDNKPASPQADLCHRLNRGESDALLFLGHCDFAAGREAMLNDTGMGTLVACLQQAASPPLSLALEMVGTVEPLLDLHGSLLPAVLDLSRIVLTFGSASAGLWALRCPCGKAQAADRMWDALPGDPSHRCQPNERSRLRRAC